jgi:hypothetical protein
MNIVEASNGLFYTKGILKTGSSVVQSIRNQFGFKKRGAFNLFEVDQAAGTAKLFDKHGNYVIIDQKDVEDVIRRRSWSHTISRSGIYFGANSEMLHSFIMRKELAKYDGFKEKTGLTIVINHINGDTSDNRRCNLEVLTQRENKLIQENGGYSTNKTGVSGVKYNQRNRKFEVVISGKYHGYYETLEEAAAVAKQARQDELERLKQLRLDFLQHKFNN